MTPDPSLITTAKQVAVQLNLIPSIVCGIIAQESEWNPLAVRYEPAFYVRYIEPMVDAGTLTDMTEATNRATSWGLMQVMGQTAREFGYLGGFPFDQPADGIKWGCLKFARCLSDSHGDMVAALLRYNGGFNTQYPKLVISKSVPYL